MLNNQHTHSNETFHQVRVRELQRKANKIGVALVLPSDIWEMEPDERASTLIAASQEIERLERVQESTDSTTFANMINDLLDEFGDSVAYVHNIKQDE